VVARDDVEEAVATSMTPALSPTISVHARVMRLASVPMSDASANAFVALSASSIRSAWLLASADSDTAAGYPRRGLDGGGSSAFTLVG
jgi:hypothetical protein